MNGVETWELEFLAAIYTAMETTSLSFKINLKRISHKN